jgi:hypothetical protein
MNEQELLYFAILKREIGAALKSSIPSVPSEIEDWKGQDIVYFQEDLERKAKGRISEKWFYTHIKVENPKLPRIDMLNLLSQYAGYANWADFKLKHGQKFSIPLSSKKSSWKVLLIATALVLLFIIFLMAKPRYYSFCFIDADKHTPILAHPIEIVVLNEGESPSYTKCSNGCFSVKTRKNKIRFVVKTPYYRTDTITRVLNSSSDEERIVLHTNDYALMIHFFSTSKVSDWQKRRLQLYAMFTDDARIYQVSEDENTGMELYNKSEFINKLTMPLKSLQNVEVLETVYTGNRISLLRFRQIKSMKQ